MKSLNILVGTLLLSILFYSCNKNESAPVVADQEFSIAENSSSNTIIGVVEASDADEGPKLSYEIIDGNEGVSFLLDSESGVISVGNPTLLDYESHTEFFLEVAVSDNHEKEALESNATIQIKLIDENEFAPEMNNQSFSMYENPGNGQEIGQVLAMDKDIHQKLIFSIIDPSKEAYFTINPQSGILSVNDSAAYDYELNQTMSVRIRVQDDHAEALDDTAVVEINLQNIPELSDGLVACYLFEGNAQNMVEDKNHGLGSNVQYLNDRSGNPESSGYFNGSDSYITIPHADELSFNAMDESFSIAIWVKSPDPSHGTEQSGIMIYKWDGYLSTPYPYFFAGITESLRKGIFASSEDRVIYQLDGLWDDQWHQVVMVFDHTLQQMATYFDGQHVESTNHQFSKSTYNDKDLWIGGVPFVNRYYSGSLDDLYFYNRAISADEVTALYQK